MIPKVIHYCWFGRAPLPKSAKKCIDSWKKYFPDYEIIEWNEDNFDINCCDYVREAYDSKKYAFVSDYARYKVLYEYGGVYFDTDVEVVRSFSDILSKGSFVGMESEAKEEIVGLIAPGLGLAMESKMPIIKELLDEYESRHFVNKDGSLNLTTIVDYATRTFIKNGLKPTNEIQRVADVFVYPKEYFNPMDMNTGKITITENTYSIHHYAASWESKNSKIRGKIYNLICRVFGKNIADIVRRILGRK